MKARGEDAHYGLRGFSTVEARMMTTKSLAGRWCGSGCPPRVRVIPKGVRSRSSNNCRAREFLVAADGPSRI
eukprot:5991501-Pleurochrysis_carterae.AAC.1